MIFPQKSNNTTKAVPAGTPDGWSTVFVFLVVIGFLAVGLPAGARVDGDPAGSTIPGPQRVFSAIETAWASDDARALASLVQTDGVRIKMDGGLDRSTEYSPSQSLYFFQNLFQTRSTLDFRFTRLQDVKSGERAHGMAVWEFRTSGAAVAKELRLVFLLTRQDDVWRLSEINKITVR